MDRQQNARKHSALLPWHKVEHRQWLLWVCAVVVTLVLTVGVLSLSFPGSDFWKDQIYASTLKEWVRGLTALVLLFDVYTGYQHLQLQQMRKRLAERETLFHLIADNAADMIAVVDRNGRRVYNSPAYEKTLGYSAEELAATSALEQVHPDDRVKLLESARKANFEGHGDRLEYRIRHKNGSWRVFESTASAIPGLHEMANGLVIVNRDITERKNAEALLEHRTFHDGLTDLPNRALFLDRLQRAIAFANRHGDFKFAVLFIDIDNFQVFNDSLGHPAGDELIIQTARRLTGCLRHSDTVSRDRRGLFRPDCADTIARPGGDEFTVLASELREPSDAVRIARRINEQLATSFRVNGREILITASIGIVFRGASYVNAEDMLRDAEIAMYRAKGSGKGQYEIFDREMQSAAVARLQLETDLRRALEDHEFRVYYQPIVSLSTRRIVAFEALTRWQRQDGIVGPVEFIEVANEIGLTIQINRELLHEACHQIQSWQSSFCPDRTLMLNVNITEKEFAQPDLAAQIAETLRRTGMNAKHLQLEITENITMADAERSARVLSDLKALGVKLAIDDFGTGLSSLCRLRDFSMDSLKIDRSFIRDLETAAGNQEIVRAMVSLAHSLGLEIVAEGIETPEQLKILRNIDCEMGQGFLFSKPLNANGIKTLFRNGLKAKTASSLA